MFDKPRTDAFKNTRIFFNNAAEATRIQKAAHTLGFKWIGNTNPGDRRCTLMFPTNQIGYIYIDADCRMSWYAAPYKGPTAATRTIANIEHTADEYKAWRKEESKASKKRNAQRKWAATSILNAAQVQPVGDDVVVAYKMRDGEVDTDKAGNLNWGECGEGTIVSYKVPTPNKHRKNVVTHEQMMADVAGGLNLSCMGDKVEIKSLSQLGGGVGVLDTNPKKQYGVASIPLEMWSDLASAYGALGLYNGSLKYGKANFANTPVEASIYIAAARRHLAAWAAGEEFDPADGVPNLGGVLANIAIILEARAAGTLIDDRMNMSGYLKERDALKALVKPLQVLHAEKNPKHYTREA